MFQTTTLGTFFLCTNMFMTVLQCLVSVQEICSKSRYINNHCEIFGILVPHARYSDGGVVICVDDTTPPLVRLTCYTIQVFTI